MSREELIKVVIKETHGIKYPRPEAIVDAILNAKQPPRIEMDEKELENFFMGYTGDMQKAIKMTERFLERFSVNVVSVPTVKEIYKVVSNCDIEYLPEYDGYVNIDWNKTDMIVSTKLHELLMSRGKV